jgi:hypothetical protein
MFPVAINDVLIDTDIDCYQYYSKYKASPQTMPDGYAGIIGPAKPKKGKLEVMVRLI